MASRKSSSQSISCKFSVLYPHYQGCRHRSPGSSLVVTVLYSVSSLPGILTGRFRLQHVSLTLRSVFRRVHLTGRNVKRFVDVCVSLGSDSSVDCTTRMRAGVRFADICVIFRFGQQCRLYYKNERWGGDRRFTEQGPPLRPVTSCSPSHL